MTNRLAALVVAALTLITAVAVPALGQRAAGTRSTPHPAAASSVTFGPITPTDTFYVVHPTKSLAEACSVMTPTSVMVQGDAQWPFLVASRVVGDLIYAPGPYYATAHLSHASAGSYVDVWKFYRYVRVVTADDGTALVVERREDGQR